MTREAMERFRIPDNRTGYYPVEGIFASHFYFEVQVEITWSTVVYSES